MTESENATLPLESSWDAEVAALLERLSTAQSGLLSLLASKRALIMQKDHQALELLAPEEAALSAELAACHQQREGLLARAAREGLPGKTLTDACENLPNKAGKALSKPLAEARQRSELIRHECLAQWVIVQRTVLHLSQMLEIVATGGRTKPTYDNGASQSKTAMRASSGSLMDKAV
ncbi:MAG: flagellar export chaperone FlgN [Lacipirellulaceae bacterium]